MRCSHVKAQILPPSPPPARPGPGGRGAPGGGRRLSLRHQRPRSPGRGAGGAAIHAGNPAAKVGGPDLAHLVTGNADWYNWLRLTLLEAGDQLDVITHHVYDSASNRGVTSKLDQSTVFANDPRLWDAVQPSVREVLKSTGWYRVKPFWLTETGWESGRVSEDRQAANLKALLGDWFGVNRDWVDKVFFYELQDPPSSFTFGVLRSDGSPKPSYDAYRSFIRAHPNGS